MAIGVEEVDGPGDLVMLLRERNLPPCQELLGSLEVGLRDPEREVPHRDGVAAGARPWLVPCDREERDGRGAGADDGREIAPDVLMHTPQPKDLLIPPGRCA